MSVDQLIFLDLPDKIQHLLGTPHCKCRNHHITAPVKGSLHNFRQISDVVRSRSMTAIAISRLHNHIVRILQILWITDQWLVLIANVTGKYDLFLNALFFDPYFYRGRAQQMSGIHKTDGNAVCDNLLLQIPASYKTLHHALCILYGIQWHVSLFTSSFSLTVAPFRLKHLNVRTVSKHDITQLLRSFRGKDLSPESILV